MTDNHSSLNDLKAQELLNHVVLEYLREKKHSRIWRWVKRTVFVLLAIIGVWFFVLENNDDIAARAKPHVGLIDLKGAIFADDAASSDNFMKSLDKAYENTSMQALIVRIDSPGGSPVQADYMYNGIKLYQKKYPKIKIYAVCVDTCASAAYYTASAADEIYANPSSMVGSIGVIYNGFGFVDTMQKLGVTRRLQTAGKNKGFLDQFSPTSPEQESKLQTMLDLIHQEFINKVKAGRGDRLKINDDTFSGLIWTGTQAKEMGLIDGFASSGQLARNIIKIDKIIDYTYKESVLEHVSKNIGAEVANQLPRAMGIKPGIQS